MEDVLCRLFAQWAGAKPQEMFKLSASGSNRKYWRILGGNVHCIATFNGDVRENEAFFYYSRFLKQKNICVPEVYAIDGTRQFYLQQDLGDTTLYGYLCDKQRQGKGFDAEVLGIYKKVMEDLSDIQLAGREMDFSNAYPRSAFDAQSMQWDLNYFKYYFLKLKYIPFDEELLERDFHTLTEYLLSAECDYFLYRDFQARNIMLCGEKPYYIDFQGGRRGAAQYDVASLLYSAKSNIPEPIKKELLDHYISSLSQKCSINKENFLWYFWGYVLIRIMQALGAYGYRGYFERKDYFISSIPLAINNLKQIIESYTLPVKLPHLVQVWRCIADIEPARTVNPLTAGLTVTVTSFSYKRGLPQDDSGNGGGFVFDCRALPNPGRYPEYRCYTGKDRPVVDFLQGDDDVEAFLSEVRQLVGASIKKYLERNFTSLTVSFGCTGGRHRSVYCAERLAGWIKENFDCKVVVIHREQE